LKLIKAYLACLILFFGSYTYSQDSKSDQLAKSLDISTVSINSGAANQERLNKIDDETKILEFDYKDTITEYENLKLYNNQLQRIILSQEKEISSIINQIDELDNININLIPIMLKMIDALDKFVSLDIPFLLKERTERVANLKTIMDRGDISTSEKFRKVTEAYQIESDYGRTIEAYRSEVNFEGETFNADFLRVGRVSLTFVTSNGDKAGFWNKSTSSWEESSASVKRSTIDGLKIALKQAPPTLITIPLTSYENNK